MLLVHNTKVNITHRQIEDENVGCVPHGLVQQHDQDDQEVADEPDDDDEGEEDWHNDWHNRHQKPEICLNFQKVKKISSVRVIVIRNLSC